MENIEYLSTRRLKNMERRAAPLKDISYVAYKKPKHSLAIHGSHLASKIVENAPSAAYKIRDAAYALNKHLMKTPLGDEAKRMKKTGLWWERK